MVEELAPPGLPALIEYVRNIERQPSALPSRLLTVSPGDIKPIDYEPKDLNELSYSYLLISAQSVERRLATRSYDQKISQAPQELTASELELLGKYSKEEARAHPKRTGKQDESTIPIELRPAEKLEEGAEPSVTIPQLTQEDKSLFSKFKKSFGKKPEGKKPPAPAEAKPQAPQERERAPEAQAPKFQQADEPAYLPPRALPETAAAKPSPAPKTQYEYAASQPATISEPWQELAKPSPHRPAPQIPKSSPPPVSKKPSAQPEETQAPLPKVAKPAAEEEPTPQPPPRDNFGFYWGDEDLPAQPPKAKTKEKISELQKEIKEQFAAKPSPPPAAIPPGQMAPKPAPRQETKSAPEETPEPAIPLPSASELEIQPEEILAPKPKEKPEQKAKPEPVWEPPEEEMQPTEQEPEPAPIAKKQNWQPEMEPSISEQEAEPPVTKRQMRQSKPELETEPRISPILPWQSKAQPSPLPKQTETGPAFQAQPSAPWLPPSQAKAPAQPQKQKPAAAPKAEKKPAAPPKHAQKIETPALKPAPELSKPEQTAPAPKISEKPGAIETPSASSGEGFYWSDEVKAQPPASGKKKLFDLPQSVSSTGPALHSEVQGMLNTRQPTRQAPVPSPGQRVFKEEGPPPKMPEAPAAKYPPAPGFEPEHAPGGPDDLEVMGYARQYMPWLLEIYNMKGISLDDLRKQVRARMAMGTAPEEGKSPALDLPSQGPSPFSELEDNIKKFRKK